MIDHPELRMGRGSGPFLFTGICWTPFSVRCSFV